MTEQTTIASRRIVFTRRQMEDIQKFKRDLKGGRADIAFEGTALEVFALLEGSKRIAEACSH